MRSELAVITFCVQVVWAMHGAAVEDRARCNAGKETIRVRESGPRGSLLMEGKHGAVRMPLVKVDQPAGNPSPSRRCAPHVARTRRR